MEFSPSYFFGGLLTIDIMGGIIIYYSLKQVGKVQYFNEQTKRWSARVGKKKIKEILGIDLYADQIENSI